MEEWKKIHFGNGYEISSYGNVRRLQKNGLYFSLKINWQLYGRISISGYKQHRIHILVANAFIPNPLNLPCVNHKDGNKHNNNVENLEWCTYSDNALHRYRILGNKGYWLGKKGGDHHSSKKISQFDLKGSHIKDWLSFAEAKRSGIKGNILDCCKGRRKTAGGFIFKYSQ